MSHYQCSCGATTNVIDTRRSYKRLRRRRECGNNHRFSTVEVPLDTVVKLKELVFFWANAIGDDDMISHLNTSIDNIMLGTPPPDD